MRTVKKALLVVGVIVLAVVGALKVALLYLAPPLLALLWPDQRWPVRVVPLILCGAAAMAAAASPRTLGRLRRRWPCARACRPLGR